MNRDDPRVRSFQVIVGSGQTDEARLLRPAGRFSRLKTLATSLLLAAGIVGFIIAALVLGTIIALLLIGAVSLAFIVAIVRVALRRRQP